MTDKNKTESDPKPHQGSSSGETEKNADTKQSPGVTVNVDFRNLFDILRNIVTHGAETLSSLEQEFQKKIVMMVSRGEMTEKEAEEAIAEFKKRIFSGISKLNDTVEGNIQKALKALKIATRDDLSAMETRLDDLIAKVDLLVARFDADNQKPSANPDAPESPKSTSRKSSRSSS